MGFFGIVLLVLFAIVCALLVFMVIIQDQEGEGLGGIFSGAGNAAFGSRSANVVVKFTYILGGLFFVLAFGLALINRSSAGDVEAAARAKEAGQAVPYYEQGTPAADPSATGGSPVLATPETSPIPATSGQ